MLTIGTERRSAGGIFPVSVRWRLPTGDSIVSVGVTTETAGALLGETTTPVRPNPTTSNGVTVFWAKAPATRSAEVLFVLTVETLAGILEPRQIRVIAQ